MRAKFDRERHQAVAATILRIRNCAIMAALLATVGLSSCSKPAPPPPAPEQPVVIEAPAPPPEPKPEGEATPLPPEGEATPLPPTPSEIAAQAAADAAPETKKPYFLENGMPYQDVKAMYGNPGQLVSGATPEEGVVRWQLEGGASVQVRFRGGQVDRFTSYAPANQSVDEATPEQKITRAQYDQITPGMSLYDVVESLDIEGKLMASGADGEKVYRWSDDSGASFGARFEGDKLVRKTALIEPIAPDAKNLQADASPVEGENLADATASEPGEEEFPAQAEAEDLIEGEAESGESEDPRPRLPSERTVYTSRSPVDSADDAPQRGTATGQVSRAEGRVRVIGKSAQAAPGAEAGAEEETYRQRRQRARLPEFRHSLRKGVYEVRVRNESGARVTAGLRQGKNGRDLTVSAGASGSFQVDRGSYEFYYIVADDPYKLEKSGGVSVDGQFQADIEIVVEEDGVTINHLDTPVFY